MAHEHDTHGADHGVPHESDRKAAFMGLIVGAILLLIMMTSVVALTNSKYKNEKPGAAATK